jgi:16S rRNA (uracil1498-N3)-methyltransferase
MDLSGVRAAVVSHAGRVFVGGVDGAQRHDALRLPTDAAHHVARVMRARVGDTLGLFDELGLAATATITAISRDAVDVRLEPPGWSAGIGADSSAVTLLQGVPKGDKLETIVRQATELGVAAMRPVFTARSVPRAGSAGTRLERLRAIAIAACEQSGRSVLPALHAATSLDAALASLAPQITLRIVPWESGGEPLMSFLATAPAGPCALLVGPEGGLEAAEIDVARRHGFVPVSLGARILRTETVAPALLSVLSAVRGDLAAARSAHR